MLEGVSTYMAKTTFSVIKGGTVYFLQIVIFKYVFSFYEMKNYEFL